MHYSTKQSGNPGHCSTTNLIGCYLFFFFFFHSSRHFGFIRLTSHNAQGSPQNSIFLLCDDEILKNSCLSFLYILEGTTNLEYMPPCLLTLWHNHWLERTWSICTKVSPRAMTWFRPLINVYPLLYEDFVTVVFALKWCPYILV
jgi:hypothetical protein